MKLITMFLSLTFLIGCGKNSDYAFFDNRPPKRYSKKTHNIVSTNGNKVDILWVVDNSGSMYDIQRNIVDNAKLFMSEFVKEKFLDWNMGLMSTDKAESPYLGFSKPFNQNSPDLVNTFQKAVHSLGTGGDVSEYLFYNVRRAVDSPNLNHFFRKKAHLAVILVTDEKEQSEGTFGSNYHPVNFVSYMRKLMSSNRILRFYGAFNMKGLKDCTTWDPVYAGSAVESVINQTGGIVVSACDEQFGTRLVDIGKDIVNFSEEQFILLGDDRPVVETLKVSYHGVELKGGPRHKGGKWYYDDYFNKIYFYNLDFTSSDDDFINIDVDYQIEDGVNRD